MPLSPSPLYDHEHIVVDTVSVYTPLEQVIPPRHPENNAIDFAVSSRTSGITTHGQRLETKSTHTHTHAHKGTNPHTKHLSANSSFNRAYSFVCRGRDNRIVAYEQYHWHATLTSTFAAQNLFKHFDPPLSPTTNRSRCYKFPHPKFSVHQAPQVARHILTAEFSVSGKGKFRCKIQYTIRPPPPFPPP